MRRAVILFAVFAIAVLTALGLIGARTKNSPQRPAARPSMKSIPSAAAGGERTSVTSARLAAAGHIKEAQDEYLQALLAAPGDAEAIRWLVAIRRQLMDGDARALRRQAATFEQAIALGTETAEHYNKESMKILEQADMRAAEEIEAEQAARVTRSQTAASGAARGAPPAGTFFSSPPPTVARSTSPSAPPANSPRGQNGPQRTAGAAAHGTPHAAVAPPRSGRSATTAHPAATSPPAAPARPNIQAKTPAPPNAQAKKPAPPSPLSQTQAPLSPPSGAGPDDQAAIPVPLPDVQPTLVETQGILVRVDCQQRSFVLHGPQGDQEYFIVGDPPVYVRGARSERLQEFCGLQRFVGNNALAWSRVERGRRIATGVSVVLTTQ
jgi:hypothetical protein